MRVTSFGLIKIQHFYLTSNPLIFQDWCQVKSELIRFKEALQKLADLLDLEIRVAHYLPYCSKYNPIEHRLFPHITHAYQGVVFHSVTIAKHFMEKAKTCTGLKILGYCASYL